MKLEIRNESNAIIKVIDYIQVFTCQNGKTQMPISHNESLTFNNPEFRWSGIRNKKRIVSICKKDNQHILDYFSKI